MAKLGLVFVTMVQSLHSVVGTSAFLSLWALLGIRKFAQFCCIHPVLSPSVFETMVVEAALVVVRGMLPGTFESLESV